MTGAVVATNLSGFWEATFQAASQLASGFSESANKYTEWLITQAEIRTIPAEEKFARFADEFRQGFAAAASNARLWAQAARDAGQTGIAAIMDK